MTDFHAPPLRALGGHAEQVTIYGALIDEGTNCWRPVQAIRM
jgi:hypothetical protein